MNILILHRVPYGRIEYARGIDHEAHNVTYFGKQKILDTLPPDLRCRPVCRAGELTAYEEAIERFDPKHDHFDRIISLSEYELLDAARLRRVFDVPGPSVEEVQLVRNKVLMKRAVRDAGLRVPRFATLSDLVQRANAAEWHGPTVLKPHSGASSEDVVVFASLDDALRAVEDGTTGVHRLDSDTAALEQYQLEEFVPGDILHFDGLVADGELLTTTASRYVGTCLGYANGEPLGSFHFPLSSLAREWTSTVLSAVGIRNGSFHLEAIDSPEGLVFLEIGNRVGGADVVATFELATGVHLPSEELRILVGGGAASDLPATQTAALWHGWFVFPGHTRADAEYLGTKGIDQYRLDSAVVRWVELPAGSALKRHVTYSAGEAPLAGIVALPTAADTETWLRGLFSAARDSACSPWSKAA
ncbi:ATP-grasp domain-containing protein [Burkholderia multivorans]|uniref:ATP-grasp domain-containing protein n=1 Tax=Burkholderia multivorans TaxID=87883 RepID=UPI000F4E790F|nr:ATP-grasp domain-containing protein [Burkholderia multivorans]AYY57732.1 ATP-grasp domain-containing protein [Burkholderia multivorans]MCA8436627.1 ATP-grasp domain-containing protein [Burkholderia multivorans]